MDQRFDFADPPLKGSKTPQYITGSELRVIEARNNPQSFEWGKSYEFAVGNVPFLISDKNHLELTLTFEKRKKMDTSPNTNAWEDCVSDDAKYCRLAENLGSYCIEFVQMRQGLDTLETDAFLPRGRFLYENLALSHAADSVKDHYMFSTSDSAKHIYLTASEFTGETYQNFAGDALLNGMTLHVAPFAWPFQYRNRSTAHETGFPNTGQDLTVVVKLIPHYRHLFHVKDGGTGDLNSHEFRIKVVGLTLKLAEPRFSAEGLKALTNRSLPPLRYDGNFVAQYSQNITNMPQDVHFSLQNIPMPHYMFLQLFDPNYFTGEPGEDYKAAVYKPLDFSMSELRIRFGNKPLNYQVANFSVGKPGSDLLRQEIMRTSNIFDNKENNKKYFANMTGYQQKHYLVSFCSDEVNQTLLRPLDYTSDPSEPQTLSVGIIGTDKARINNGKLVVTLIYKSMHLQYNVASGTFLERDLKSLVISS